MGNLGRMGGKSVSKKIVIPRGKDRLRKKKDYRCDGADLVLVLCAGPPRFCRLTFAGCLGNGDVSDGINKTRALFDFWYFSGFVCLVALRSSADS